MVKKVVLFIATIASMTIFVVTGILLLRGMGNYSTVMAFSDNETSIIFEDKYIEGYEKPIIEEGKILLPINFLKDYIYSDIEHSNEYDRLYVNIDKPIFSLETEELTNRIKDGIKLNFLTEKIENISYLNIIGLEKIFNIKTEYNKENNVLIIDRIKEMAYTGRVKKGTNLRLSKSPIGEKIYKLEKNEKAVVFEKDGKWVKARTNNGYIGYALQKNLEISEENIEINYKLNEIREAQKTNERINLVWAHISKYSPDLSKEQVIEGLDIISPTWFSISSDNGFLVNNGDIKYSNDAHEKGYRVWGLIDNSFDKDLTKGLLLDEKAQENVINQILVYASIYNLDGINIDFENVYYENKDNFTLFVDKLTKALKEQNLVVSIDMTVPSSSETWSKFYDREKLGQIVDYCMVMTYDEHWSSSPISGSVASIEWVEKGLQNTLKYIPNEKLIMGIPFYTREWEETKDNNGRVKVKSKAFSMEGVNNIIKENNSQVIWLEETGQHYTEYIKDGKKYRIWLEDEKSIELKSSLVHKYDLAGVASWRKGFETENIWPVLNRILKENSSKLVKNK